jgi:imidazolonepropionase-like amidohydrolase
VASAYDPLDVSQYREQELKAAVDAANDWGTYVLTHVYNARGMQRCIAAGVKCIEHGHLTDEASMKLMAQKGVFLSTQVLTFLTELPGLSADHKGKLRQAQEGTDVMMRLAKKHGVKIAWGTDLIGDPRLLALAPKEFAARLKWFTPVEILRQATVTNGELLALSGPRNPYPGKLGVIAEGALADLLVIDGNPLENIRILEDPDKNLKIIMKDGKLYKNSLP